MTASTTKKKKSNTKTILKSSSKTPPVTAVNQSKPSLKDPKMTPLVTPEKPLRKEKTNHAMLTRKQSDVPKVSNNNSTPFPSTTSSPSSPDKSSTKSINPFTTWVNIESLTGHAKQKYLKSSLVNPIQSCLYIVIDQDKADLNYQATYKNKLGKIIQSLRATDENADIVKYTEHIV